MTSISGIRGVSILGHMRKTFVLLALFALALPVAGLSAPTAGEGTLSVQGGRGTITVKMRGGVIGRLDRGNVTVTDLTPEDAYDAVVFGYDQLQFVGDTAIRYSGAGIRYRLVGGSFRIVINGRGIDVSVVGKGNGVIRGESELSGVYSLDGVDCRKDSTSCKPLPEIARRFQLGAPDREKPPVPAPE